MEPRAMRIVMCRGCGCTDLRACEGGCSWVLMDVDVPIPTGVCSACAIAWGWDQELIASAVHPDIRMMLMRAQEEAALLAADHDAHARLRELPDPRVMVGTFALFIAGAGAFVVGLAKGWF
jgi:hypothetical protein